MTDKPSFVDKYFGRLKQNSVGDTLKQNFAWKDNKAVVFGRVAGTLVGAGMAYDAVAHSLTADGEERSGLVRLTEFIVGGALAAGSVLAGKGK